MFGYEAILHVENPLSFRTNEYGNVIRMGRVLHNWALMFAMNGIRGDPEKDHLANLDGAGIYCTPAVPREASFQFQTFHPFPEAPNMIAHPQKLGSGSVSTYQRMFTILHYKEFVKPGSTFVFGVLSERELPEEMIITYGGKQTLQRIRLSSATVEDRENFSGQVRHPINPLDFKEAIQMKNVFQYSVPPSPLFQGYITSPIHVMLIKKQAKEYVAPHNDGSY